MKLIFLFGNAAVGKMTVGQELMKLTGLRLFHNHMTIEPVIEIFGTYNSVAIQRLREVVFEEFSKSDCYGMIFTFMWAFDQQADWDYVEHIKDIFRPYGTEFYYVELVASQKVRLERNATENRLRHKASKRDVELSNQRLLQDDAKFRLESLPGEITFCQLPAPGQHPPFAPAGGGKNPGSVGVIRPVETIEYHKTKGFPLGEAFCFMTDTGSVLLLLLGELVLAYAAQGADPILGEVFELGAGGNAVIGVAHLGVIAVAANVAHIHFHGVIPPYID